MDSVRFGRVLGIGARLAAKTVVSAVDAATAPNPSAEAKHAERSDKAVARPVVRAVPESVEPATKPVQPKAQVRQSRHGLKQGGKRFGEAIWGPFARLGGVLWLEVTGVFFGLMALSVGTGAWKMRGALHDTAANHGEHVRLLVAIAMTLVFGYFCVSSYVRASRKGKRR